MTNKQALVAVLRISVPDDTLEKALLDHEITGSTNYTKDAARDIDMCAVEVLKGLLSEPDVTEGGYSIKYDRNAIQARIDDIMVKWEMVEDTGKPTISNGTNWW